MWKALEAVAKTQKRAITISYKPANGGYVSKNSGKWRIDLMGTIFINKEPMKVLSDAIRFWARAHNIDIEKALQPEQEADNDE
ncbi:hypothetical protein SAMN04488128_103231 [Chitinophaga eiseniae]|uniref:Uncharacterized protein n=2 Tax=Chitinophaga eiseniae TaxID=634771 RepID=A0A1T4SPJ4_9BACT|nr:hypothetical protein SAMN04488128_103231 [Chitinophaga eiseniae]